MTKEASLYAVEPIETLIATVRGQKVILDANLARVYGVPTKRLNEQVRRNAQRFPQDFAFRLSEDEAMTFLCSRSQNATGPEPADMRSQIATASKRNIRFLPYAFTEHGAIMAANVLNSPQAVHLSVFIVRAFVKLREQLLGRAELEARLAQIENVLLSHDKGIRELYAKIRPLLLPPPESPPKQVAGFRVKERRARYGARPRANLKPTIADRESS